MEDNQNYLKGINHYIKSGSKNDLKERIYDYGMGQKFHIFSKEQQKTKEYRAVITSDFGLPDMNQYLRNDKISNNPNNLHNTKGIESTVSPGQKTGGLNNKFNALQKENVDIDNKLKEEKFSKNLQEIESITGFKTLSPLPPSRGNINNFENPMIERYKLNLYKSRDGNFLSTKTKLGSTTNQLTLKNFTSKAATTIIDLDERKKKNVLLNDINLKENKENKEKNQEKNDENEEKPEMDEEDKNMDIINKFIREAFEGKDYRTNFVYYLPSGKENYYDLKQADFNDISKEKVYYTLSAKGLTVYVEKKPKEFIKLSEWIIERQAYNFVSDISFFKNFKIWRILKLWRQNIFRKKKINYDSELRSKLLFNNKDYNRRILEHKRLCNKILHFKILDMRQGLESITFDSFKEIQEKSRKALRDQLVSIQSKCDDVFTLGIKSIFSNLQRKINLENNEANYNNEDSKSRFKKFLKQKKDDKKDEDKKTSSNNDDNLISEDNIVGFENLRYKSKNSIKTECMNFIKLAFIFDYIMLDVLRKMYLFSMKEILEKVSEFNKVLVPKFRENYMNKNGDFSKPQILLNPNRLVSYLIIKCNLDNSKTIHDTDKVYKKVESYHFEIGSDELFDPTIHLNLERNIQVYKPGEKEPDNFRVEVKRLHKYYISFEPDCDSLVHEFITQICKSLDCLKINGWKGHPHFKKYLAFLEDWDDRFGDWDNKDVKELEPSDILKDDDLFIKPMTKGSKDDRDQSIKLIRDPIVLAYRKCDEFLSQINPFLQLHYQQKSIKKELLLEDDLREQDEVYRLLFGVTEKNIQVLKRYIPYEEEIGLLKLSLEDRLRKDIVIAQNSIWEYLKPILPETFRTRLSNIEKWFNDISNKTHGSIQQVSHYLEKKKAFEILDMNFPNYEEKLLIIEKIIVLCKSKGFHITSEDINNIHSLNAMKSRLKTAGEELNDSLTKKKEVLKTDMYKIDIPALESCVRDTLEKINQAKYVNFDETNKSLIPSILSEIEAYHKKYKEYAEKAKNFNEFLKELNEGEEDFSYVQDLSEGIIILKNLWETLQKFDDEIDLWRDTTFKDIKTKEIISKLEGYEIIGKKAKNHFNDKGSATIHLLNQLGKFMESMKVIEDLSNSDLDTEQQGLPPGVKEKYWVRIQALFDEKVIKDVVLASKEYKLDFLLHINAYSFQKQINEISRESSNNKKLKETLDKIELKWKEQIIDIKPNPAYHDVNTIFKIEETVNKIEELQVELNNVMASRYVRFFKQKVEDLKNNFENALDYLSDLKTFQKKWMYLSNILTGTEMKKLSQEMSEFQKLDENWKTFLVKALEAKKIVPNIQKNPQCKKFDVKKNIDILDRIQMRIEDHLKVLRGQFARFYFISNDDLLYILSNGNDLEKIKPYFGKIFEDVSDFKLAQTGNKEITHLISITGEELELMKIIRTQDQIEKWLEALEESMNNTIRNHINKTNISDEIVMEDLIQKNISQVVATKTHQEFCIKFEIAVEELKRDQSAINIFILRMKERSDDLSKIVNKNYTPQKRRIITNLITHYVHNRDMVEKLYLDDEISDINEFAWQQQLRTYYDGSGGVDSKVVEVVVRQLRSEIFYGYEYIGPMPRVVITPLTDRVWLTITASLSIKLGCSLGGPAGTGKTETTKDLAKFFGFQCIVFNCSEQIDYKILGNIFSGLAKHKNGAYTCLDEFNRINVEVLSVVAQQLLNIRMALQIQKKDETVPVIILDKIDMIGKLGIFITMNPTYAGRTELPDNLKALFRPITMMVPDFQIISKVKLSSEGFKYYDKLAEKLDQLYKLASQQLSQQDHYDFTLRTLGSVLAIAGNLKRLATDDTLSEEEIILIRAIRQANIPKFLPDDILMFNALIGDLFPGTEVQDQNFEDLREAIKDSIIKKGLENSNFLINKCIQLFDIVTIRLGVCLIGPAGSGKTACYEILEDAMTSLRKKNHPDPRYKDVKHWTMNPKSVSMGELYGMENEETRAFIFGIMTKKIKKALADEGEFNSRWVMLDGPIDTKWIENLNSVLDDSMTLCLSNGERIKLKNHIKIFFEVEDLAYASLATVSRMGIIYMQANELGWRPYMYSWMKRFLPNENLLTLEMQSYLKNLFEDKVDEAIENISDVKDSIFIYPVHIQCVMSICHFLEFFFKKENGFLGKDAPEKDPESLNRVKKKLVSVFCVSVVWGVFGCVSNKGFNKVENFVKNKFPEIKLEVTGTPLIMEHFYDFKKGDFINWQTKLDHYDYVSGTPYFSIFVNTIDSLRYSFLLEALCSIQKNILVTGETGVGKSSIISNSIRKLLLTEEFSSILMNFSAQTNSEDTQRNLEAKLDKKKGKKVLGGKNGKKVLLFIDDINMPEPTEFNSHPPIELIRQYLDFGEIYDRTKYFLKKIEDTSLIIAGGPPIGGRSKLTSRFTRHFSQLCIPQAGKEILIAIFDNILKGFLTKELFHEDIKKLSLDVTLSTIDIYDTLCKTMKPIPAKFHYSFNLRDVSRVFQGLLMIKNKIKSGITFAKLWVHEVLRIFGDRLINDADLKSLQDNVVFLVKNKIKCNDLSGDNLFKIPIFFGQIHKGDLKDGTDKPYEEIGGSDDERRALKKKLEYFLELYNKNYKRNQLNLVFFDYAINHIVRITRVLRQPRGNIVLIGQGGTGKQTLTKFCSFIMESVYCTFSPTKDYKLQTFRKDIKEFIITAGIYQKRVSLVLTDNNVTQNFILEDINSLLNNGEIANLLDSADYNKLNDLTDYVKKRGLSESRDNLYENFIELTRENLHIIFCTSPVGDALRIRCRKFPALINCCTLNWFVSWPQEALVSCCENSFKELSYDSQIKRSLVDMCTQVQLDVEALTERFWSEVSRRIYVTPKSFLDMISLFVNLLKKKKGDFENNRKKLFDGVKKLDHTSEDIVKLEALILKLEPEIIKQQEEANISNEEIKFKKRENEEKEIALKEKSHFIDNKSHESEIILRNAEKKKTSLDNELRESWKEVEENVNSESIANMLNKKVENNPGFISLYEAVALVTSGNKVKGFTEAKNALVSQMRELAGKIKKFKDEISSRAVKDSVMEMFKVYIHSTIPHHFVGAEYTDDPEVLENTINDIKKRNRTLGGIFIWGTAIIKYWELEKEIGPIREDIEKLNEEVKGLREQYDELNSTYLKTLNETKALMHKNEELTKKIKKFEDEIRINSERKKNAKDLIRLLKDEGIRWKETLSMIDHEIENFLGNIFLSSAIISYLSPFTGMYRKDQVKDWIKLCNRHKIKVSQDYSLETTISDQVEIRSWNINGLPSDSVSKENAIMMFNNPKFILLIDPQVQGNYWLKKMFKQDHKNDKNDDSIRIYKGDKTEKHGEKVDKNDDMALKLTVDIQRGSHVLIENVGIKLDTLFNPLIMRLQFEDNGASYIEFNSIQIEYNNNFRIFFTTKLSNPHYSPEMFINLNIINFTVTFQGLTEQLLSEVFKLEKREKYEQRDKLIEEMGECNAEIKNLEKIILERLAEAKQETILDDNELIETLERSKVTSEDINVKVKINKVIEDEINKLRNDYIPVATRGSILYFVIVDISNIDPMYQFSLEFFKKLFNMSIQKKRKGIINTVSQRVDLLEKKITKDIFRNIKRGIFENHKTIFSFLIAIYIKKTANVIKDEDWNFFLKGPPTFDKTELLSNPDDRYFTDHSWDSILYFQNLYQYADFSENITKNLEYYKKFFNDIVNLNQFEEFVKTTKYPLPNNFFKLLMIKMFRPEKLLLFVKYFIIAELGKIFTDNTPPKLDEVFAESDYKTPIIFILSQGADPADNLIQFKDRCNLPYEEKKEEETVMTLRKPNSILISLGQGQNHIAEDAIDNSVKNGDWVILQNCHLFKSWMTILGEKVQKIQEDDYPDPIHPHFRLWLTSMPNEFFPISVLQNGLKITTEPPSGVKANVKNLFDCYTANLSNKDDVLLKSKIKDKFPRLAISLSFFHAVMQERKKFGPIGFNLRYDFNLTDYDTSYTMMLTYVDENEDDVPWKSITYLVGDVNYGGRVTDDWDRRTMKTTLKKFLTEKLFDERYKFTPDGVYFCPNFTSLNNYMDYVESLPLFDDPEFFGLHSNANIIFQLQESNNLVNTLLKIIPKTKSSGKSPHEIILETIKFFAENKPDLIERKERAKVHEKIYENGLNHSLSIVMYHEVEKFNKLLTKIQSSLENLEDAIKGTITMSNEGEEIFNSLHLNKIPLTWSKICYPSHKPLASWFKDLLERVNFIRTWLTQGHPHVFWLPGLFFPQGFITGVLQTHARDFKKPVSEISFKYKILQKSVEEIFKAPATGVYIDGLFLEGASWDFTNSQLIDQNPGEMSCKMPVIWFETVLKSEIPDEELEEDDDNEEEDDEDEEVLQLKYYKCPLFKTLKRTGIISASGRSDNFIRVIVLPSKFKKSFFILRGTALICQLDD